VSLTYIVRQSAAVVRSFVGKIKKKCCRSERRCKACPVLAMRRAKLEAQGLRGKDLKRAIREARAR
jgi:hypothetical protein